MTLSAIDAKHLVKGVKGPTYKVGPYCANPTCQRIADHAHHIFRRSMLGGPFHWVEIDGVVFGNLTGLCVRCHDDVTGRTGGHKAAIRLELEAREFFWCHVESRRDTSLIFLKTGRLDPQPPTPESSPSSDEPSARDTESDHCPLCGQHRRRRAASTPPGPRRRRKTWSVAVPDDAEDGADVLDTFVDEVALLLGAGDWHERNKRYWALVHVLAWTMQRREEFAADVKAAA